MNFFSKKINHRSSKVVPKYHFNKKFFEQLSRDISELLDNEFDYNVVIEIGEQPNSHIFKAHSVILYQRCPYFRKSLKDLTKSKNNIKEIKINQISARAFQIILKYIYGGTVSLENLETSTIFDLMVSANELSLDELVQYLESQLIENDPHWLRQNFVRAYDTSTRKGNLKKLNQFCVDIIVNNPDLIFVADDFTSLQETVLTSILKRKDLQTKESNIWELVIRWGIAHSKIFLTPNPANWSDDEFTALRTTLQNCLPLIQYSKITGDDILYKVQPYQAIIDQNTWSEMIQQHNDQQPIKSNLEISRTNLIPTFSPVENPISTSITTTTTTNSEKDDASSIFSDILSPVISSASSYKMNINIPSFPICPSFSAIINREHATQIASWIDNSLTPYDIRNNPYKFKLIFRGSRDGFDDESFYDHCENQPRTVIILRVKGTNEILGGYNSLTWNKEPEKWTRSDDSFIFSLRRDNQDINEPIISRIQNADHALFYDPNLSFGFNFGGGDLGMMRNYSNDTLCWCQKLNYEKPIRSQSGGFSIDEYEVFKICGKKSQKNIY
ncbi:hypothetical protein C2G38_2252122 [Gigaspora rosea]|uniref:BTB/POZ domain-containing protein n=1 Tax=Gigaspora rosea TaxID=44941 RepID=A0A397UHL4_9GLOM|nr:hypothetical protein C2G38_2252122 [Gigaspora rosea]